MGWENIFQVEIDSYCQKVLEKNFPKVKRYKDVKEFNGRSYYGTVDIISGGFPCQPHSVAGERKASKDDRDLWSECVRALCEIRPRYALFENVTGLLTSERGKFFNRVLSDLAKSGYDAEWGIISACAFGAPHTRKRLWIFAYSTESGLQRNVQKHGKVNSLLQEASNNNSFNLVKERVFASTNHSDIRNDDGIPKWVDRIGAVGNAIVPQVAYEIFKAIQIMDNQNRQDGL